MESASFHPTVTQKRLTQAIILAKAHEDLMRPIVLEYETAVLEAGQFKITDDFAAMRPELATMPIAQSKFVYMLSEADANAYFDACYMARDRLGLRVNGPENCPLLEAESFRMKCENALLKTWEGHPRLGSLAKVDTLVGATRDNVVDKTVKLMLPFLGEVDIEAVLDEVKALGIEPPPAMEDTVQRTIDAGLGVQPEATNDSDEGVEP